MAGDVGGEAEERRMPERQHPGVADQQVERAGKQGEAQHLRREQGINRKRRHHADYYHDAESHQQMPRRACGASSIVALSLHIRMPGQESRRSDQQDDDHDDEDDGAGGFRVKNLVSPSITPSPKPVRIDPMIDPMPPITTTAKTTMIRSAPISGLTW